MWTILTNFLGAPKARSIAAIAAFLLLMFAGSVVAVKFWTLKQELATTLHSLQLASSELGTCRVTVDTYLSLSNRLEKGRQQALEKANQVSGRTQQLVKKTRAEPVDNNLESIRKQGLSTAPDAADLWTR